MTTGRPPGLVLVATSLVLPLRAQTGTVAGTVIDDRTDRPIQAVLVSVENQSSTSETDAAGRFTMTVSRGRQIITASMIGYAVYRVDVEVSEAPVELTIRLLEGAGVHAERVTVAGSLSAESDSVPGRRLRRHDQQRHAAERHAAARELPATRRSLSSTRRTFGPRPTPSIVRGACSRRRNP